MINYSNKLNTGNKKVGVSLLTVPLKGYRNGKTVNCLFSKTTIRTALS